MREGEYHIFHFIGHGGFDRQAEDGVLIFEAEDGRSRQVGAQYLGTVLHDHRSLRLAVLNACEGARGARDDPFSGTAQGLVQQGIPAVIAMRVAPGVRLINAVSFDGWFSPQPWPPSASARNAMSPVGPG